MVKARATASKAVSDPLSGAVAVAFHRNSFDKKIGRRNSNKSSSQSVVIIIIIALIIGLFLFLLGSVQRLQPPTGKSTPADDPAIIAIPECTSSPWKENENLAGQCPNKVLEPKAAISTIPECAQSCCDDPECVVWQYRSDTGCLQGKDIRIGMEKDGTSRWCEASPPVKWQGQYVGEKGGGGSSDEKRQLACSIDTWNPAEQQGQCFGLGDQKKGLPSTSAEECMKACCNGKVKDRNSGMLVPCGAWQWNALAGCFYGKWMHGCQKTDDNPMVFQPFVGRRKRVATRTYTDKRGKPWPGSTSSSNKP